MYHIHTLPELCRTDVRVRRGRSRLTMSFVTSTSASTKTLCSYKNKEFHKLECNDCSKKWYNQAEQLCISPSLQNYTFYQFFHTKTPDSKSSSTLMVVLFFAKRLALMAAIFSTDIASLKDLQINIRGKNWIKLRNQLFMTLGTNLRLMKGKSTLAMAFREYNFEVCIFPPGQ